MVRVDDRQVNPASIQGSSRKCEVRLTQPRANPPGSGAGASTIPSRRLPQTPMLALPSAVITIERTMLADRVA
jgi:hypothetical protein